MSTVVRLSDETIEVILDIVPVVASLLGLPGRDDRLPDFSEAGHEASIATAADIAARAEAADAESHDDQVTRAVIRHETANIQDLLRARAVEYTVVDSDFAPVPEVLSMLPMLVLSQRVHADGYLARLAKLPDMLATVAERHRIGLAGGRPAVRRLAEATVDYYDRMLADPEGLPLRRPTPAEDSQVDVAAFTAERDRLLDDVVRPALAKYREVLATEVVPHGRPDDRGGLCWLPGGDEIYTALVRSHITVDRTPEELHQTGLSIIARLAEEYVEIGEPVFGTTDLGEIWRGLRTDPAMRWKDADELLDAARATILRAEEAAPEWFGRLPGQRCQVQPIPAAEAPGSAGAYYMPPSLDGTRPGVYFANTHKAEERDRFTGEATAFHEAVPGHHFQSCLALELTDLPLLRRLSHFSAYLEGWGLYAERLADEMGLYSGPVARLGMLSTDSLRAARLVVDTGLHAKGWSRQQAVDYMTANTPLASVEIESEVDRYISAPGQALSYMVGRLEIDRMRADARRALGDQFDIRGFHDTVLGEGPLPLGVLDEVVRSWVQEQQRSLA